MQVNCRIGRSCTASGIVEEMQVKSNDWEILHCKDLIGRVNKKRQPFPAVSHVRKNYKTDPNIFFLLVSLAYRRSGYPALQANLAANALRTKT